MHYDILLIDGDPGVEQLIRGVSENSVKRYGRRSKKIERPLAAVGLGQTLVEEQLDKYCFDDTVNPLCPKNPLCRLQTKIPLITDAMIIAALLLKVSDQVTIQVTPMGLNEDFWVDDISFNLSTNYAEVDLRLAEVA